MNIKKNQLKNVIKQIVRENLAERNDEAEVKEAGMTSEAGSPLFGFVHKIVKAVDMIANMIDSDPASAKAKLQQLSANIQQNKLSEASYKQVSPNETDTAAEDKAREIQTDPKVNESGNKKSTCQKCKGKGHYTAQLKDRSGKNTHGMGNTHIIACDQPGCHNGKIDRDEYYRIVREASYKVVAPRSATDAKEDKARKIQTEPKVNETAYKTQGPSYRTFDDSPQFPDAVNDPENQ